MRKHLIFGALLVCATALAAPRGVAGQVGGTDPIRPGDVVRLRVLRDSALSGDYPVNEFGTVVLPLLGEYDVSEDTNRSLRTRVIKALMEVRFGPDIELVVLRRVRVTGEVNEPGVYSLDPTLSVADAVAMAKGRTALGQEGRIVLRRGDEVIEGDLRLDARLADTPIRSGDEIQIPRLGWINRNVGPLMGTAVGLIGIIVTIVSVR